MKKQVFLMAVGITAVGVGSLLAATHPAWASHAEFPIRARKYRVDMVRAMDQCDPATISVFNSILPNNATGTFPSGGCFQTNVVTDETPTNPGGDPLGMTMFRARLVVKKFQSPKGKIKLVGSGFVTTRRVRVLLTLRTTRKVPFAATHSPAGPSPSALVTFEDVTIQCGDDGGTPPCFSASPGGRIAKSMTLQQCLTNNGESTGFAGGNVEIVESALVNCEVGGTGKIFARPGILNQ